MKKYLKKILALTLILSLCTTTMLSGTLAKYTSEESGTATVTAAQFYLDSDNLGVSETIELTHTKYDDAATDGDYYETGATLFPGQSGYFAVDASFISDVDATITATVATALYGVNTTGTEVAKTILTDYSVSTGVADDSTEDGDAYMKLLDKTGLRFTISSSTSAGTTYYKATELADAIAGSLFDGDLTATDGTSSDGIYTYAYDASTENSDGVTTVKDTIYVHWNWEYEATDANYANYGATFETSTYTYNGDAGADLTDLIDVYDTAWGNAVYEYTAAAYVDDTTDTFGYVDFIIDITINATQLGTAIS